MSLPWVVHVLPILNPPPTSLPISSLICSWFENTHVSCSKCPRRLQHCGKEFWSPRSSAGDLRRFCVDSYDQEARSWTRGGLTGLWLWAKLQSPAVSTSWGRHSYVGQPSGQVPAEGPCAQCNIPEDWVPDLWGQWALPGSSHLHWRIRTYPGFPPHCLWWVTPRHHGFPTSFVLGESHRPHFSGSLLDTSFHILFSLQN